MMRMQSTLIEARETVALVGPGDTRAIYGAEALESAGYDPEVFHAVVPSEAMRGGKVNKNDRIYGPCHEVAAHHMSLVERAREGYVGGQKGHPLDTDNPTCPSDAIRILDGDVVAQEDGSNLARALVGILKTSTGTDAYVMWKAGKPTGLSLNGVCTATEHKLDAKSPYAAMNPGATGRTVELRRLRSLDTYDVVFDPSFGTFFSAPDGIAATESVVTATDSDEIRASADRLRASGHVIDNTTSRAHGAQENTMDPKDIKELEAKFPELVKQLRDETANKAATEATANVSAQAAADRERVVALEAAKADTESRLKATEGALAQVRADLARKEIVAAVHKAVESWAAGKPGADVIAAEIKTQADAGSFQTAEEATKGADTMLAFAQRYATAQAAAPGASIAQRAGMTGIVPAAESVAPPAQRTAPKSALEIMAAAAATPAN